MLDIIGSRVRLQPSDGSYDKPTGYSLKYTLRLPETDQAPRRAPVAEFDTTRIVQTDSCASPLSVCGAASVFNAHLTRDASECIAALETAVRDPRRRQQQSSRANARELQSLLCDPRQKAKRSSTPGLRLRGQPSLRRPALWLSR